METFVITSYSIHYTKLYDSSIEPETFSDRFIALFENPKLCRHLHLCLQSGSDHILIQMRRNYNTQGYMHAVEQLKNSYPDFTFTTDIMVGFPGETDEDFAQTLHMANSVGFSHIHTFKYSARQGTRSARSTQQVTRITSYNVCYTKLLRMHIPLRIVVSSHLYQYMV